MINYSDKNVFGKILSPLMPIINSTSDRLGDDDKKYKLSFLPFTVNLLYAIMSNIRSCQWECNNVPKMGTKSVPPPG